MAGFFKDIGLGFARTFGLAQPKKVPIKKYKGFEPYSSLKEIPEGQKYATTLQERLAGRGVGFREKELSSLTSPYAAQARAGLKEQTIPQISAQASARGVGRSTIPVSRIGLESAATERSIEEKIAALRLANEAQRRQEINQALSGLGQFTSAEAAQRGQRAGFDIGEFRRVEEATRADALQREREFQEATRRRIAVEASFLDSFLSKYTGSKSNISGIMSGGQGSMGTGGQVNTGQLTQIMQLFKMFGGS